MEPEYRPPLNGMEEDTGARGAMLQLGPTSGPPPETNDAHQLPLAFDAPRVPDPDTIVTAGPTARVEQHLIHAQDPRSTAGHENAMEEASGAQGEIQNKPAAQTAPAMPYKVHSSLDVEASAFHQDHSNPDSAGQSHTSAKQIQLQEGAEVGVDEQDDYEDFAEARFEKDSAYDGDSFRDGDTDTLASFITNYRWENGRRYHAYSDGAYWGPNDEDANDGQDLAHHLYKLTLDEKLHLAPIGNPQTILDVGTGTGIWAIEMADLYPSAHVIGTDLSPIQPTFVPPNCQFEIEDANLEWTYPPSHFDFIHVRELFGSVDDWDKFFAQTLVTLKPGGYLEILEHSVQPVSDDGTVGPESFFTLWGNTVIEMGERRGKSFDIWKESRDRMERAGFEEMVERRFKWPMNGWSKDSKLRELGQWNQLRLYDGIEGMMIRMLTGAGGWSYQRAQIFLAEMRAALKDYTVHAYLEVSVVYGRKPLLNYAT